jgi:hypothetical protein
VLENLMPRRGRPVVVELVGTRSNRDAIGTRVSLDAAGEPPLETQLTGGGSYLSHGHRVVHIRLPETDALPVGTSRPVRVVVRWPSGTVTTADVPTLSSSEDLPAALRLVEPAVDVPPPTPEPRS